MLNKIFNILFTTIAFISLAAFCFAAYSYPQPTDEDAEFFLPTSVYLILAITMLVVLIHFLLSSEHGTVEGFDKDKGIDEEVTLFMKRGDDARTSNEVVVTMLSEQSNREIKNLLRKIENLEKDKEGVVAKLIISLIFAVMCVTLYLTLGTDIPRGPLAITIAFISTFSVCHFFMQIRIDAALTSKSKAISKVALKHQRISDGKGSEQTIKPYIFDRRYNDVEGFPMKTGAYGIDLYLLIDKLRTVEQKSKVDKILKDLVLIENSDMSEVDKDEVKFKLVGKIDTLHRKARKNWLYTSP